MPRSASAPPVEYWETDSLSDHVSLIRRQMDRSLRDPETRRLAMRIVNGTPDGVADGVPYVTAWGQRYRLPHAQPCAIGSDACESQALWDFWVLNVRYTPDPAGYDFFATLRYTLEAGGGDCDDSVIGLGALHRAVGFANVKARVISTSGVYWEHIYLLTGFPRHGRTTSWVSLDPTVKGATPGWQFKRPRKAVDFRM